MISGEAAYTNSLWFNQTGINPWSTTPEAGMLTITPQMRLKGTKLSIVAP
jgi:hypothetical protein